MSAKTYFLNSGIASNVHQRMSETSPGADGNSSPNYGWTVGTTAAGNYASADARTMVPAASFGATAQPDGSIVTTQAIGDCWRSHVPLEGSFAAGTWTFQGSVIQGGSGTGGKGKCRFRLFRSVNSDGSSATEETSGVVVGSEVTLNTLAQTDSVGTVSLGAITLTDEYLFVQIGWEVTVAAGGMSASTCAVIFRVGNTASTVVTTDYTQATGVTEWKEAETLANVAGTDVDWLNPELSGEADGDIAQFIAATLLSSDYLMATTYGFAVPTGSTIDNIDLRLDRNATVADRIADKSILPVVGGSSTGTDKSAGGVWATILTIASFTWTSAEFSNPTVAQVNAADFGVQTQAENFDGLPATGQFDQTMMRIHYTEPVTRLTISGVAFSGGASMSF